MLLVIDVGNTNMVIGAMNGHEVVFRWRITTVQRTTDEFGMLLLQLLQHRQLTSEDIEGVCVSCVVPSVLYAIEKASRRYLQVNALVIGKGIRTGMRVRTDNPREVGADRSSMQSLHSLATTAQLWWWTLALLQHWIVSAQLEIILVVRLPRAFGFPQMLCLAGQPSFQKWRLGAPIRSLVKTPSRACRRGCFGAMLAWSMSLLGGAVMSFIS